MQIKGPALPYGDAMVRKVYRTAFSSGRYGETATVGVVFQVSGNKVVDLRMTADEADELITSIQKASRAARKMPPVRT
jgi:hypothetical protein